MHSAKDSDLAPSFGDLSQSETLYEIKPTLVRLGKFWNDTMVLRWLNLKGVTKCYKNLNVKKGLDLELEHYFVG